MKLGPCEPYDKNNNDHNDPSKYVLEPEDVFNHTMMAVDEAAKWRKKYSDKKDKMVLMLGILCHDLGKPDTTEIQDSGKITTYGHDDLGEEIADKFLRRITNETDIIDRVKVLVKYHMRVDMLYNDKAGPAAIRRLARKVDIPMLAVVEIADKTGRGTVPDISAVKWLLKKYKELNLDKPEELKPRVTGKHLITMGVAPGPEMGKILNTIYDAQMEGKFADTEGGIEWARGEGLIKSKRVFVPAVTKKIKTDPAQEAAIKRMYGIAKSFIGQPNNEEVKDKIRKAAMKILSQPKPENPFTIDLQKSRKMLVKVRKSQLEGKSIPYKHDGKVIWAKVHEGGLVIKADKKDVIYGSKVFVKSDVAKVTGIGKDGIIARTEGGKKHQVLFKDLNMWIER